MVELGLDHVAGVAARAFMLTMVAALVSALVVSTRPALVSSAIPTGICFIGIFAGMVLLTGTVVVGRLL